MSEAALPSDWDLTCQLSQATHDLYAVWSEFEARPECRSYDDSSHGMDLEAAIRQMVNDADGVIETEDIVHEPAVIEATAAYTSDLISYLALTAKCDKQQERVQELLKNLEGATIVAVSLEDDLGATGTIGEHDVTEGLLELVDGEHSTWVKLWKTVSDESGVTIEQMDVISIDTGPKLL